MTAASAYPPQSPDPAPSGARPPEPSMEDILASIRRIIADDQTQGGKSWATGGTPTVQVPNGPAAGSQVSAAPLVRTEAERQVSRARSPYDDVLDLARLVPPSAGPHQATSTASTGAPERGSEPSHVDTQHGSRDAAVQPAATGTDLAAYRNGHGDAPLVSSLRARLPEPQSRPDEAPFELTPAAPLDDDELRESDDAEGDALLEGPLGASVLSAFETLAATVVLQNGPMLERVMRDLLRPMLKTWLDDNLPTLVERLVRVEIERVARGHRT